MPLRGRWAQIMVNGQWLSQAPYMPQLPHDGIWGLCEMAGSGINHYLGAYAKGSDDNVNH